MIKVYQVSRRYIMLFMHNHSLANKTVQLRPKSTTGSSFFYWSISGTFVGGYDPSLKKIFFHFAFLCELILCVPVYA